MSCRNEASSNFIVYNENRQVTILVEEEENETIQIAANLLAEDIERITGYKPQINATISSGLNDLIIIGSTESNIIKDLERKKLIKTISLQGNWESYQIQNISDQKSEINNVLVICGSDRRGTAYGIMELTKRLGTSPWYWWADVTPEKKDELKIIIEKLIDAPVVKYRGIFLNDECWGGLQAWAANNQDKEYGCIGPKGYAKIFELMLRLKANTIWPAMHNCTKAFYNHPDNPRTAHQYGIIVGSSHCEPMLCNNIYEWERFVFPDSLGKAAGEYRYDTNRNQVYYYWEDKVKRSAPYESIYTLGMRGISDGPMTGPESEGERIKLLHEVIHDQQNILKKNEKETSFHNTTAFCVYKDLLDLYRKGLNLPDSTLIIWPDDNMGYIKQLPLPEELQKNGSHGVYYHISSWPWLWLSTISPVNISYEMTKAYQNGANNLWMLNVGDIKPMEIEMDFFLTMAWDPEEFSPECVPDYIQRWYSTIFGEEIGKEISEVKKEYYRLAQYGRPEHLSGISYSQFEIEQRLEGYAKLSLTVERCKEKIPERLQDSYYQLVYYPVIACGLMNEHVLMHKKTKSLKRFDQHSECSRGTELESNKALIELHRITEIYNHEISNGKWNKMMSLYTHGKQKNMPDNYYKIIDDRLRVSRIWPMHKPFVEIPADGYHKISCPPQYEICVFKDLGIGDGLTLMPAKYASFDTADIEKAPAVEFNTYLPEGRYRTFVNCLPTYPFHKNSTLRYAISMNGRAPQIYDVAERTSAPNWWTGNQIRGYMAGETFFEQDRSGEVAIRVYLLDTGLVINSISIFNEKAKDYIL